MGFRLSERSMRRLEGVHPGLVALAREAVALSPVDFMVTEGLRTPQRQAALVRAGASRTRRSRHLT
ncbi:MAG: M15 family peptidase, partial [Pseudomonadota bacterium]|nr:M15 family peptidase [Pseudomonadota bacterium]